MNAAFDCFPGRADSGLLFVVDHASCAVPDDIDLGIGRDLIERHIGWDIGAAALAQSLSVKLGAPAIMGTVSRLVIDLHREQDSPGLIPETSDGHPIPGNRNISAGERQARIMRYWRPYHDRLAALIEEAKPALIVAVHSFTLRLETSAGPDRPWQVGILYNRDDRAARLAIERLRAMGIETGDNQPYSGQLLNATMNRHAEERGIAYLAIEVRNDLIREPAGVAGWSDILEHIILDCRNILARVVGRRP